MGKRLWKMLASLRLSLWLLLAAAVNLVVGAIYLTLYLPTLGSLNRLPLDRWLREVGLVHPSISWWLLTLLALLVLLGVNAVVCSLDRLRSLAAAFRGPEKGPAMVRAIPTLIHLLFLGVLAGHLLLSLSGYRREWAMTAGQTVALDGGQRITLVEENRTFHAEPATIRGLLRQAEWTLTLEEDGRSEVRRLRFLDSFSWHGLTFHLSLLGKSDLDPQIRLLVQRRRGQGLIFGGFFLIVLLLGVYYLAGGGRNGEPHPRRSA